MRFFALSFIFFALGFAVALTIFNESAAAGATSFPLRPDCPMHFAKLGNDDVNVALAQLRSHGVTAVADGQTIRLDDVRLSLKAWSRLIKNEGRELTASDLPADATATSSTTYQLKSRRLDDLLKKGIMRSITLRRARPGQEGAGSCWMGRCTLYLPERGSTESIVTTLEHEFVHMKTISEAHVFKVDPVSGNIRGDPFNFHLSSMDPNAEGYDAFQHASEVPAYLKTAEVSKKTGGTLEDQLDSLGLAESTAARNSLAVKSAIAQIETHLKQPGSDAPFVWSLRIRNGVIIMPVRADFGPGANTHNFTLPLPEIAKGEMPKTENILEYLRHLDVEQQKAAALAERRFIRTANEIRRARRNNPPASP